MRNYILSVVILAITITGCSLGSGEFPESLGTFSLQNESSTNMYIGNSQKLTAIATFMKGTDIRIEDVSTSTVWRSETVDYATVSESGLTTCISNGGLPAGYGISVNIFATYQGKNESMQISCFTPN